MNEQCSAIWQKHSEDSLWKGQKTASLHTDFTLWFQLEDTVLLIGTLLLFDPILFPIYEA